MITPRLRHLDLNLLFALDALLAEQSVTRAGESIGLSQSAMSGCLSRLRDYFDDPLLASVGNRMQPTELALELEEPIRQILEQLGHLVDPATFDPASVNREFSIAMLDQIGVLLLPALLQRTFDEAPNIKIHSDVGDDVTRTKDAEQVDLWIVDMGGRKRGFQGLRYRPIGTDHYVCAVCAEHPDIDDKITMDQYLELPHAVCHSHLSLADIQVRTQGVSWPPATTVSNVLMLPLILSGTPLVATIPYQLGQLMKNIRPIKLLELPFELAELQLAMLWSERVHKDPAHVWLRNLIASDIWPYGTRD